jgi:hypothetical protein
MSTTALPDTWLCRLELWWARRFFARMTFRHVQVISAITGAPMETVLLLHPALRRREHVDRVGS